MDTNRFIQLRSIFDQGVALPPSDWDTFLEKSCPDDATMRAEVKELLLAHHNAATTDGAGAPQLGRPARMVGRYRILREIGAGGMGVVYLATRDDGAFRKNVAVKLLKAGHDNPDLLQRFHQERQVLANLDHPNIARILDGGETSDGTPYHVMDYVEGLPLDRFCDEQRLDLADRIRLFQQVVAAVQYLHGNLVVHRDLKPSNILVTGDGQVKLLDFGIAKIQTIIKEAPDLTGPANRMLTPGYASPEQISGAPVAKSSDVYSLGVILYELLTGRLPFSDASAKLSGMPPLPSANIREDLQRMPETTSQLRRRIVGDLDQIVMLCLRRDPRHRYTSAAAVGEDLQHFLEGRSVHARREPLAERTIRFLKRNRVAVSVVTVVLLFGILGAWKTIQAQMLSRQIEAREAAFKKTLDSMEHLDAAKTVSLATAKGTVMTSGGSRVDDVRKLRQALAQDIGTMATSHPSITPVGQTLLDQALRYLDKVRASAISNSARDVVLATELANTYKDIGMLYEPASRDRALIAYGNAATVIELASDSDPDQGAYHEQWAWIRARIKILGGNVPMYIAQNPAASQVADTPQPAAREQSKPPEAPSEHDVNGPAAIVISREDFDAIQHQLDSAVAKSKQADEVMRELEENLRKDGETINQVTKANHIRINIALESARRAIDRGDLAAARENIGIANEFSRRVLSVMGR